MPEVQQWTRFHYQYLVLHDFLPRIVNSKVLEALKTRGRYDPMKLKYFEWRNEPFMPVEFSVAAYRFGHSMVRPGYRLNDDVRLPIFPAGDYREGLGGFNRLKKTGVLDKHREIDWARFVDTELRPSKGDKRLQFAYRIDTSLVDPLANLPKDVAPDVPRSLTQRNLIRGWRLDLPSGQQVARAMGETPLLDKEILIGKDVKDDPKRKRIAELKIDAFTENCPLWTYILAEATHHAEPVAIPVRGRERKILTPRLGPVGGRIVAEVFLGLMFGDPSSLLRVYPNWKPDRPNYALKDFVQYALGR
jgi:hypothetical protein